MALKEIIVETQASLRADAANAKAVFSIDSRQLRIFGARPGFASSL
jgi:hypothetical protein